MQVEHALRPLPQFASPRKGAICSSLHLSISRTRLGLGARPPAGATSPKLPLLVAVIPQDNYNCAASLRCALALRSL